MFGKYQNIMIFFCEGQPKGLITPLQKKNLSFGMHPQLINMDFARRYDH
jgi:hypothetical protein